MRLGSLNPIPGKELRTVDNFSQLVSTMLAAFCKMGDAEIFEAWTLSATSRTLLTTCLHVWLNHRKHFNDKSRARIPARWSVCVFLLRRPLPT